MFRNLKKELLNKEMRFSELDDCMVKKGYYPIFFEGAIKDLKKCSNVIYEKEDEEFIGVEEFKQEVMIDYKIIDEIEKNLIIEITEINFI